MEATNPMKTIRILIADDHPVFRFGLKALLATEPGVEVVGEASRGEEAVKLANTLAPDVILMDINMPGLNGIEATRQIAEARPGIGILIITMLDDDSVFAAMRAGARGYLLKGSEGVATLRAIHTIAEGGTIFSPGVAGRVTQYFTTGGPKTVEPFPELTEREREILTLLAHGLNNADIAEQLVISQKTVRNHISNIFNKLQVSDRLQAALRAREAGLGES
jgi:DNA-binding NarL/FixJ family response regulator